MMPRLWPAEVIVVHRKTMFIYRGAQAVARGGARCASKAIHRCARPLPAPPLVVSRRYLIVVPRSLLRRRDAAAAGEEQLCLRAAEKIQCCPCEALNYPGAARPMPAAPLVDFCQVIVRDAKVVAAAPRRCRKRRRTKLLMCGGKAKILPVCRIIRVRVIMTSANCSPAVASRRGEYVDEFNALGCKAKIAQLFLATGEKKNSMALQNYTQLFQRGGSQSPDPRMLRLA
jgi:hypothetical protein